MTAKMILAAIQFGILGTAAFMSWNVVESRRWTRRPGATAVEDLRNAARFLLGAVGAVALATMISTIPAVTDTSVIPVAVLLAAGPLMLAGAAALPRPTLSGPHRTRVLVDGLMITVGAATFAWYFLLGPAVLVRWPNLHDAVVALGYPGLDVLLVAVLLVISAKSRIVRAKLWGPLAGATALMVLADCVREISLQSGTLATSTPSGVIRIGATTLLAIATVQLAHANASTGLRQVDSESASHPDISHDGNDPSRIWKSLLPYALVPATAALAVYSWQRDLASGITAGVVVGTAILVVLTFFRQLLAARENHRLYQQAATAYEQSLAYAKSIQRLNNELNRAKEQLQENNGELARANQRLHDQATRDPLTGLPNHRAMVQALDHELDRAGRYGRPCSLLFVDLDHFKALNDSCGHLCGDAVLREIVNPIQQGLRSQDVAGRWGGEEFVILLPETELTDAMAAAERFLNLISNHRFAAIGGGHLTCSVGVAACPYDATTRDGLIEAADKAMYAAKRLGKNQVRSATDPSVVAFLSDVRRGSSREEVTTWGIIEALTTLVRAHDPREDAESVEIADLAMRVAATLRLSAPEIRTIGLAARLHDVGMVSVPHSLDSRATALESGDQEQLASHPVLGADIVGHIPGLVMLSPTIRAHHERWDGSGYPDGLAGEEIPLGARVIAACDRYCSMVRPRDDSKGMPPELAIQELERLAGIHFDARVVDAMARTLDLVERPASRAG